MPLIVILLHQRIAARQLRRHRSEQGRQRIGHIIGRDLLFADQRISQLRRQTPGSAGKHCQRALTDIAVINTILIQMIGVIDSGNSSASSAASVRVSASRTCAMAIGSMTSSSSAISLAGSVKISATPDRFSHPTVLRGTHRRHAPEAIAVAPADDAPHSV